MGTLIAALVRLLLGLFAMDRFLKLQTHLEKKLDEPFGWRTDLLVTSSIVVTFVLTVFIFYNFWALTQPLFTALFIK